MAPGINSKKKGSRTERDVAKLLKKWSGYDFARTPGSGGLRWKKTDNTTGDIVCTDAKHRFPFSIEVKNYKDINFSHLLYKEKSDIKDFWNQCLEDSVRGYKVPLLLMRYNGLPKTFFFAVLSYQAYRVLRFYIPKGNILSYNRNIVILSSNDLFNSEYLTICKRAKKLLKDGK